MDKIEVLLKVEQVDMVVSTTVICASKNHDLIVEKFREAVENEKQFEIDNLNYDTINETDTSFEAYNEGYMAESSVQIYIQETVLV